METMVERELRIIRGKLTDYYSPLEIEQWLAAAHPLLNGERAIDLIEAGRTDEVHCVIQKLEDGVYL